MLEVAAIMILAGDIGGTKTNLAVFEIRDHSLAIVAQATFPSREHAGLEEIAKAFLTQHRFPVDLACFGIAGPVRDGHVDATNLPWAIDAQVLSAHLGVPAVRLLNDLEATAYGIDTVVGAKRACLQAGAPAARGNRAVIAAGTGLGEAGVYWDGRRHSPFACEGGHSDFAPRNELETDLFSHLYGRFGHVAWERVLSGPGLVNLYEFLRDSGRGVESPQLAAALRAGDPAATISAAALSRTCALCEAAVDLFVSLYGAEAGNLALKVLATGGVFVGGGIAPHLIERLKAGAFLDAFVAKGRMEALLRSMPVLVLLDPETALWGAARAAALAGGATLTA
ncbi:MAG: glucokinase [Planctomycetaceae bacterium]|nr:glucokinase [Planctomycetaceae bacterium]